MSRSISSRLLRKTAEAGGHRSRSERPGRRLISYVCVSRIRTATVIILGIASIGLNVVGPRLLGHATNLVVTRFAGQELVDIAGAGTAGSDGLAMTLSIAIITYGCSGLCWIAQGRVTASLIQERMFRLRSEVQAKLAKIPVSYLDRQPQGDLLSRVTNDVDNIGQTLQQTISQVANSLLLVGGVLVMMFWISPSLAALALATIPLSTVMTTILGRHARRQFHRQWDATGLLSAHIEELYAQHALVKAFGRTSEANEEVRQRNDELIQHSRRAQFISGIIQPFVTLGGSIGYVMIAVVGGLRVASGTLSIGEAQAFIQYSRQLGGPLTNAAGLSSVIQSGIASARRVFEVLDSPEEDGSSGSYDAYQRPVCGRVCFESVSFQYEPDRPLIKDLSFTVEPGQTVAIVGPTGAGKTTLVNLLTRFYEITHGRITLDGRDISQIPRDDLRAAIGMVFQEPWIFTGTIADNIGYGRREATRHEVEQAACAAQADHFIRTLPCGYDSIIDHDETTISNGERQLITIARAFIADSPILVLDEATSAVDARTEVLVQQAIARLSHDRTSFIIAHRLSTIRTADMILVMNNGMIQERGTHEELVRANGYYAQLYAAQFARTPTGRGG